MVSLRLRLMMGRGRGEGKSDLDMGSRLKCCCVISPFVIVTRGKCCWMKVISGASLIRSKLWLLMDKADLLDKKFGICSLFR